MSQAVNLIVALLAISAAVVFINWFNGDIPAHIPVLSTAHKTTITETHNRIVFTQTRLDSMNATCIVGSSAGAIMMSCNFDKK